MGVEATVLVVSRSGIGVLLTSSSGTKKKANVGATVVPTGSKLTEMAHRE